MSRTHLRRKLEAWESDIFHIYADAISMADTKRGDLKERLRNELIHNFDQFENTINRLTSVPAPKSLAIDSTVTNINTFWHPWTPNFFGGGSRLRRALVEAQTQSNNIKQQHQQHAQQKVMVDALENPSVVYWDHFITMRDIISAADWDFSDKKTIEEASYHKQAEALFRACVLPHQTNYRGVVFAIEDILFLLGMGFDKQIEELLKKGQLSNPISDTVSKGQYDHNGRFDECGNITRDSLLNDFFQHVSPLNFKNKELMAHFIDICQEWLFLGAYITGGYSISHNQKNNIMMLDVTKKLQERMQQIKESNIFCPSIYSQVHQSFINYVRDAYSAKNVCPLAEIATILHTAKKNYETNESPTITQIKLFLYKICQHLRWILGLSTRGNKELITLNKAGINNFLEKHPAQIYEVPDSTAENALNSPGPGQFFGFKS